MEKKPYEVIEQELAMAKDTLLNEVIHRQQLASQLQTAAINARNFQSQIAQDMREIRDAAKENKIASIIALVDRAIGPEPKEMPQAIAGEAQAAN